MKHLFTFLFFATFIANIWAQSPDQMSYQAIIRDADNHLVQDANITMRISILQGSATGTIEYLENHDATTNSNGLVTVQIGTGTTTDDFSSIDWATGPYFIKTETDPAGGTDYTLVNTSQLLSVPYALHANTANNITGSAAADITATDIENLSNLSGINSGDQNISRTGLIVTLTNGGMYTDSINTQSLTDVIAEGNLAGSQIKDVTDPTDPQDAATKAYVDALEGRIAALESRISALEPPEIGEYREGGIVFYIFQEGEDGYVSGEYHGLICADTDQGTTAEWGCIGTVAGASSTEIGSGEQNTIQIENNCSTDGTAADLCANLTLNSENDWYLPSKDELNKMYENKTIIDNTAALNGGTAFDTNVYYWSSSEATDSQAWLQSFSDGGQLQISKTLKSKVRAVRTF